MEMHLISIKPILLAIILTGAISGCGALSYKTVNYANSEAGDPPADEETTLASCDLARLGYTTYIQDFAESTCIGCHVKGGTASSYFQLIAGDPDHNLEVFASLLDGTAASVFTKASGQITHGGGAALKPEQKTDLENFYKMLSLCQSN